jgi:hypothetical protein
MRQEMAEPPPLPEALSPPAAVVPGQLLAPQLSLARGLDPDAFSPTAAAS